MGATLSTEYGMMFYASISAIPSLRLDSLRKPARRGLIILDRYA
jgi:hypothetical protein